MLGRVLTGRMPGVGLSEAGHAQAAQLAAAFARSGVVAVVASPQRRAQETAAPIAARLALPLETDPGLDEIDFGAWSGQDFAALDADPAWHDWNARRSLGACPGGETMLQAQSRAIDALRRRARAGPVVLVSHQDVIKAIVAHLLGLSLDQLDRFAIDPASTTTLALTSASATILAVNHPPLPNGAEE